MKPDLSKFFTPYKDPESGVVSCILTKKVAPLQQGFYFVNSAFSTDNRFFWFYCAFPPSGSFKNGRTLGVIDFEKMTINHFPDTAFCDVTPLVCDDGSVYWGTEHCICRRGPDPAEKTEIVSLHPGDLFGGRAFGQVATHLTLSPNKRELFFDAQSGNRFFAGTIDITNGKYSVWQSFDRLYNHGQICPTDEDIALLAQENMTDPYSGAKIQYEDRLWIIRRDGTFRPIFPRKTRVTHEWWCKDGKHVFAINQVGQMGGPAVIKVNVETGEYENVWQGKFWHAEDFDDARLLVADQHHLSDFYRGCPSKVVFINRESGKSIDIIGLNPEHHTEGSVYHIDPHPRFSTDGSMVVFTTTVRGEVDVALAFTSDLLKLTT